MIQVDENNVIESGHQRFVAMDQGGVDSTVVVVRSRVLTWTEKGVRRYMRREQMRHMGRRVRPGTNLDKLICAFAKQFIMERRMVGELMYWAADKGLTEKYEYLYGTKED